MNGLLIEMKPPDPVKGIDIRTDLMIIMEVAHEGNIYPRALDMIIIRVIGRRIELSTGRKSHLGQRGNMKIEMRGTKRRRVGGMRTVGGMGTSGGQKIEEVVSENRESFENDLDPETAKELEQVVVDIEIRHPRNPTKTITNVVAGLILAREQEVVVAVGTVNVIGNVPGPTHRDVEPQHLMKRKARLQMKGQILQECQMRA